MKSKILTAVMLAFPVLVAAQTGDVPRSDSRSLTFDQSIDRALARENALLELMRAKRPVVETYIQEMAPDPDFGAAPSTDHYFLGKLDINKGISLDSFLPDSGFKQNGIVAFKRLFSATYMPRGFAQTLLIDGAEFDRNHYDFQFVRREFLGDVRTILVDVSPKPNAGQGHFLGRIWIEDRDFNIVRFNGTYTPAGFGRYFLHFDSWRLNCGPGLWVPYEAYVEESSLPIAFGLRKLTFKASTHIWGYTTAASRSESEFTNMTVDLPAVRDHSDQAADNSPVESLRAWERQGEENILSRLEKANILAPVDTVEKVLDTVVNNLMVTNDLDITPEVRTRVILTTPLETFTVGHTIVISRGLLDTLPDEASLAAILSHELAHIALGQIVKTEFAFADRVLFDDDAVLRKFRFARSQAEEEAANTEALELMRKSPYAGKLKQAGLFLKALATESDRLPNLIKPLFGSRMAQGNNILRLAALLQEAPELQRTRVDQIAALSLGARTTLNPWDNRLRMATIRSVPLLSAREKMPFELSPIYLHLRYDGAPQQSSSGQSLAAEKNDSHPDSQIQPQSELNAATVKP